MQTETENAETEHEWAVTDSQGHAMQCLRCEKNIYDYARENPPPVHGAG